MAKVRRRTWSNAKGEQTAWIADYFDQDGKRHIKTFKRERQAKAWLVTAQGEVVRGVHTPENASITVAEAAQLWFDRCKGRVEYSTERQYRSHLDHIKGSPIGAVRLSRLTMPAVAAFRDEMEDKGVSTATVRKILTSLKSAISAAQERGLVAQNVAAGVKCARRERHKLDPETDFPSKEELQKILLHAGKWYPLLVTAAFTGMRSSELRGLHWADVDLDNEKVVHVRRRADQQRKLGDPKSRAGQRTIPLVPVVENALRAHKLASRWCAPEDPVFANRAGKIDFHASILDRGFAPVQVAAGIVGADGKTKYGLHALRHFFASWIIGLRHYSAKELKDMLGHASVTMTFDTYGGLFTKSEEEERADRAKLAEASRPFLRVAP